MSGSAFLFSWTGAFLLTALIFCGGSAARAAAAPQAIELRADEDLRFFPSYAVRDAADGRWRINIHAWVFEPEKNSVKRKALINILKEDLRIDPASPCSGNFDAMAGLLLVDQERGREILVSIAGNNYFIGTTNANGHAEATLTVEDRQIEKIIGHDAQGSFIPFSARSASEPVRLFSGKVRVMGTSSLMVVSDIDDTIKISNVLDRRQLIENTMCKPFQPVPGMARLYRKIAGQGAVFHYVSASPWQLYPPLSDFLRREGFPGGLFYLKYFGFSKNISALFASSDSIKLPYIRELLRRFPDHRFIFFGDSGERDPEIYGECARSRPGQVASVIIRNVTGEKPDSGRMRAAFRDVPAGLVLLIENAGEIESSAIWEKINR